MSHPWLGFKRVKLRIMARREQSQAEACDKVGRRLHFAQSIRLLKYEVTNQYSQFVEHPTKGTLKSGLFSSQNV